MKYHNRILLCSTILGFFNIVYATEEFDIDSEISRLRKELTSITAQRKSVKDDVLKDEKEFSLYSARIKTRFETMRKEIDSIQLQIKEQTNTSDSLSSVITALQNSKQQIELQQDHFRNRLISSCDMYLNVTKKFPPIFIKPINVSISFLKSELIAKNIDNVEGIQRLCQIIKDIEDATGSIQIVQGTSPVSDIRGTVYQIRMGTLFEAVVNIDGTTYAIWSGYDQDGKEIWKTGNDSEIAEQLLKCVNVREGKTLPAFVKIPLTGIDDKGVTQ